MDVFMSMHTFVLPWLGWYFVICLVVEAVLVTRDLIGESGLEPSDFLNLIFLGAVFENAGYAVFWLPCLIGLIVEWVGSRWNSNKQKKRG